MGAVEDTILEFLVTTTAYLFGVTVIATPFLMVIGFIWSIFLKFRLAAWAFGSNNTLGAVEEAPVKVPLKPVKSGKKPPKPVVSEFSDEYKLPSLPFA